MAGTTTGSEKSDNNPIYALKDIPGKGKGLVAAQHIPKGTRILSEQPIVSLLEGQMDETRLKAHVSRQIQALSEQQRHSFLFLHNLYPYQDITEQYLGIIRTNALPIEADGVAGGIFFEACRINHACDNNAQKNWNRCIKRHTVHALRDIPKGEEITIYYLGRDASRARRRERLREKFGFLCSCNMCSLPTQLSQESDARIQRIADLDDLIGQEGMRMNFSLRTLRYADEMVCLYNKQGPGNGGLPRAFFDAAQICIANSDLARGRVFAERAVKGWRTAYGNDSDMVEKNSSLAQSPATSEIYGLSQKWKRAVDDVPQGLDPNDFEDWLWRREKPKSSEQVGQLMSLRDRNAFPSYDALPGSYSDPAWYDNADGVCRPRYRWCFLGEIVDSTQVHHLELKLSDINGKKVPLHFYTARRGSEWSDGQLRTGFTVGVFHAKRHVFVFGDAGIRLEDKEVLKVSSTHFDTQVYWDFSAQSDPPKIFPVSLQKMLELSDRVQQFATKVDGLWTCHGCNQKASSLNRCGKCSWFWYCNTVRQPLYM